jgi:hypothetical protein
MASAGGLRTKDRHLLPTSGCGISSCLTLVRLPKVTLSSWFPSLSWVSLQSLQVLLFSNAIRFQLDMSRHHTTQVYHRKQQQSDVLALTLCSSPWWMGIGLDRELPKGLSAGFKHDPCRKDQHHSRERNLHGQMCRKHR